ncbi:MAG: phosphatase PAP2 family protein [Acidobacteria bacterium]|nr:phosphatase PAP2 family protein [Acidobacteriota bacterium]
MKSANTIECGSSYGTPMSLTGHKQRSAPQNAGVMQWSRAALAQCGPYEWVTLGYLGVSNLLLLLFRSNLPDAEKYFLLHGAVGTGMLVLVWGAQKWPFAGLHFARHWYPFALFIYFFEELHHTVHLIFPGWFDRWLIAFDFALFGVHPTVWLERFAAPATNDLMAFFYLTYYFYTVALAGVLYAKKEWKEFWTVMTATAMAYAIGYVIALVFPIEGPYHTLRALQRGGLEGGPVTLLMSLIQQFGRVHGAAFPSLHVAGAFVALLGARQFARRLFWVFLPLFAAMCVSTVYGRYHYVADIFGGLIVGAAGFWFAERWEAKKA